MTIKREIFLISVISGLLVVAVLGFIFYYLLPIVKQSANELISAEIGISATSEEQSKKIKDTYEKMVQDNQKITNFFVNPVTPLDLISYWEKITGQESLTMQISPVVADKYKYDTWKFLGFEITLSGKLANIQNFIEKIENSKYLIEINNLGIRRNIVAKESTEAGGATAIVLVKAYINKLDDDTNQ